MNSVSLHMEAGNLKPETESLRIEVRQFLAKEIASGGFVPQCDSWIRGSSSKFSRKLGARGWLGMTWPKEYGGHERTQQERFVVIEELLAAGAPVAGHWVAERQMGLSILRSGTQEQKETLLPPIARGERIYGACYSEPDVGSDLASVRTKATRVGDGWIIDGTKIWTSHGHAADYLFVLCRSGEGKKKHEGLTMLIVPAPIEGLTVRPLPLITGEHHFNEMIFENVKVPHSAVLGVAGEGWKLLTAELAIERSGPERFLSTLPLLRAMVARAQHEPCGGQAAIVIGEFVACLRTLRSMSISIATAIEDGRSPNVEAAMVKDLGTRFEGKVAESARSLWPSAPSLASKDAYSNLMAQAILHAPTFTLRGGTNEVLRGIIARGLGVR